MAASEAMGCMAHLFTRFGLRSLSGPIIIKFDDFQRFVVLMICYLFY